MTQIASTVIPTPMSQTRISGASLRHLNDPPNKRLHGWTDYDALFTLNRLRGTESHSIREANATAINRRGNDLHLTSRNTMLCLYTVPGWILRPSVPQGAAGLPTDVAVPCMSVDDACIDSQQYAPVTVGPLPLSGETHDHLRPTPASCLQTDHVTEERSICRGNWWVGERDRLRLGDPQRRDCSVSTA